MILWQGDLLGLYKLKKQVILDCVFYAHLKTDLRLKRLFSIYILLQKYKFNQVIATLGNDGLNSVGKREKDKFPYIIRIIFKIIETFEFKV